MHYGKRTKKWKANSPVVPHSQFNQIQPSKGANGKRPVMNVRYMHEVQTSGPKGPKS